jgi:mannose-6-phosphate isomerase
MNEPVIKPWGSYQNLLESEDCKVKKIVITPNNRPSYQYHFKREEKWIVVRGEGTVTLDDTDFSVSVGDVINVPLKARHRIKNTGKENLIFIEVQIGTYFGEDDIVRLEDDYGR